MARKSVIDQAARCFAHGRLHLLTNDLGGLRREPGDLLEVSGMQADVPRDEEDIICGSKA